MTSIDILDLLSVDSLQAEDDHIQMSPPVSMDQRCHNNVTHVGTRNLGAWTPMRRSTNGGT